MQIPMTLNMQILMNLNLEAAKLISKKIKPQFVDSADGRLMHAIVEQALLDASRVIIPDPRGKHKKMEGEKISAMYYLSHHMVHAEMAGVDSEWIRSIIRKIVVFLPIAKAEAEVLIQN